MEHVYFADRHCLADRRGVHARVLDRGCVAKFGGSVGGVRVAECLPPRRMVGLFCHWIADRFFIAALHRRINFVFARTQHVGIRAWIRDRDRDEVAALASQHVDGGGHDLCVVVGGELDLGIYLEHPRNLA